MGRRAWLGAILGALLIGATAVPARAAVHPDPRRRPAAVSLVRCDGVAGARCGSVTVPLDRAHPDGRTLAIAFELRRHRDRTRPPLETIVAVEGGPGYPTRGSRDSYLELFDPLLDRHDLLLVDNRGTGTSGVIVCEPLQSYVGTFFVNVGKCGRQLGDTADDYGTGNAVEDMVAVLDTLGLGRVDLYGDSYGTFFSQTFAVRHPERLRAFVLDGAYPIESFDPWYRDSTRAMRDAFRFACARQASCAAIGGDPIARMSAMAARLRVAPLTGDAPDADGQVRRVTLDAAGLSYLAMAASGVPDLYRELDPAIRAALRTDDVDPVPLLRLAGENLPVGGAGDPADFSEGLYAAAKCHDYPQAWDPTAPPAIRRAQYAASIAALPANAFAPFTVDEWLTAPLQEWDYCLRWPSPSVPDPPRPPGARYPRLPTLVLTSDLDSNTSPEGARTVARRFGAPIVESANYTHVSALGDFGRCASRIVVRFVRTLSPGDTSCTGRYNETRVVDTFVRRLHDLPGRTADERLARAATATVGDVVARRYLMTGADGVGLRGGTFTTTGDPRVRFRLRGVRWVTDVAVDGTIAWQRDTGAVAATLTATGSGATRAHLTITWNDWHPLAQATVTGDVDGRLVALAVPAP